MDVRAINLRLGDAVVDAGSSGHVTTLGLIDGRVMADIVTPGGTISINVPWNTPVQVLNHERRLPATPAQPKPTPKPRSSTPSGPRWSAHDPKPERHDAYDADAGVGYWQL